MQFPDLSADFTRIPYSAPLPVPTMIAVGVARPNAQGQEITRTANTNRKGKGEGLTDKHPHDRCDNGNRDDGRDENAADLICQLGNGCLRGTRFLN